jgi:hypothetical protein
MRFTAGADNLFAEPTADQIQAVKKGKAYQAICVLIGSSRVRPPIGHQVRDRPTPDARASR